VRWENEYNESWTHGALNNVVSRQFRTKWYKRKSENRSPIGPVVGDPSKGQKFAGFVDQEKGALQRVSNSLTIRIKIGAPLCARRTTERVDEVGEDIRREGKLRVDKIQDERGTYEAERTSPKKIDRELDVPTMILYVGASIALLTGLTIVINSSTDSSLILNQFGMMFINISLTVLFINVLEQHRFRLLEKRELIRQMASAPNHFAAEAVTRLRSRAWLANGSLKGAVLEGARLSGVNLADGKLVDVDFSNADLSMVDLRNVDLSGATLVDANLTGALLKACVFDGAKLSEKNQNGIQMPQNLAEVSLQSVIANHIDLTGKDLRNANVSGELQYARLIDADLSSAALVSCDLKRADLSGANLRDSDFSHAKVYGAKFPTGQHMLVGASFSEAQLVEVNFSNADLRGVADFRGAHFLNVQMPKELGGVDFTKAVFCNVELSNSDLRKAVFKNARLKRANLRACKLGGAKFERANLTGADLTDAELDADTSFRKAKLKGKNTKLPVQFDVADYRGANFTGADLSACNLSGAQMRKSILKNTSMPTEGTRLARLRLKRATIENVILSDRVLTNIELGNADCNRVYFDGSTISEVDMGGATLNECRFRSAVIRGGCLPMDLSTCLWEGADLSSGNLQGRCFDGATMKKVKLVGADIRGASFVGAVLGGADLRNAVVDSATDMTGVIVEGADTKLPAKLACAKLKGAQFACGVEMPKNMQQVKLYGNAKLLDLDLTKRDFSGSEIVDAELSKSNLSSARMVNATLVNVDLDEVILKKTKLIGVKILDVDLSRKDLSGEDLQGARLSDVDLSNAILTGAKMARVELIGINLCNAKFDKVDLTGARFSELKSVAGVSFQGANFSGVEVDAATKKMLKDCISEEQMKKLSVVGRGKFIRVRRP